MDRNGRQSFDVLGIDLRRQLQAGVVSAFFSLVEAYADKMAAVAYALLGRHDLSQDVVQDVLISLWDRRDQLDIHTNIAGYLYRMVRNRATDILRHEQTEDRVIEERVTTEIASVSQNSAEQILHEGDLYSQLQQALQQIPQTQRQVFLLSFDHGLSYAEIAEALGLTIGSVRTLMYRATQRLAQIFPKDMLF